ncbi:R3H domain-containing protein 2-like [Gracilinanus agilis]|uniref:R3H domain-containing protein 2-like n=1 Tax=Gracilinanus agilis TaxID=191870 RepID=UPI001CFEAA2C|nr:R3H domain-containing protein 2-like [Gracilinanus agilis]
MQLNVPSVPNGSQAPQTPSMVQWSHCKYYSMDQRGQKPGDLYNPESSPQANTQMNSPLTSPTQSPTPSPVTSLSSVCTGLGPLPVLTQFPRPVGPAQGDGRYSLLGQPLQYNLSICPPLLHGQSTYSAHQGQTGIKHGNRGKRQALKSASTDLGTADVGECLCSRPRGPPASRLPGGGRRRDRRRVSASLFAWLPGEAEERPNRVAFLL